MNTISSLFKFLGETLGADPSTLKTTDKTLVGSINSMWDIVYPVGSYYETSDAAFDPNVTWGGTWSLEESGKVHIGAGTGYTIGATGGEATHLLTSAESGQRALTISGGTHTHAVYRNKTAASGSAQYAAGGNVDTYTTVSGGGSHSHSVSASNATSAHNNMQPYIVVNRWHRTA